MLTAVMLLAAAPQITTGAQPPALAKPCKPEFRMARDQAKMRVRPLSEMPPARQILGVYREVGGCAQPGVVRARVGAEPRR